MTLNRNEILFLIAVFKVIPIIWFSQIEDSKKIMMKINLAKRQKFLSRKFGVDGYEYLILEAKGYERVREFIPLNYEFKGSNNLSRVDSIHRNHHRMIFHFLISWLNLHINQEKSVENPSHGRLKTKLDFESFNVLDIYTDYEPDKCRFAFDYSGYEIDLRPDLILRPRKSEEEILICLEADTGSMSIAPLYNKILRYAMFSHLKFNHLGIQKIKLYFSFQTKRRAETVFKYPREQKSNGLIYPIFDQGISQKFKNLKSKAQIRSLDLLKVFKEEKIELFYGLEKDNIENYKKVDLFNQILEDCEKIKSLGGLRVL